MLKGLWVWLCCWLCDACLGGASLERPAQVLRASQAFYLYIYIIYIYMGFCLCGFFVVWFFFKKKFLSPPR